MIYRSVLTVHIVQDEFVAGNYGVSTTPETEWKFVAEPDSAQQWPVEIKLADAPEKRRTPLPLDTMRARLDKCNVELAALGEEKSLLSEIEAFGGRLYT